MADMLVKLYTLPDLGPLLAELKAAGIEIRPADPVEKHAVSNWARRRFQEAWALGCEVALEQRPPTCFIAVQKDQSHLPSGPYDQPPEILLGFACYDVDTRGMFGPLAVQEDQRGRGIGRALLLACLHAMRADRYAYAVIGWAGPTEFYAQAVGATLIPDSEPGIFRGKLKDNLP